MTRDDIEALCDQLTYRPVGTTAAQMREAATLLREATGRLRELAECRRDAERYRWLRDQAEEYAGCACFPNIAYACPPPPAGHPLDDAIDVAMAGETA